MDSVKYLETTNSYFASHCNCTASGSTVQNSADGVAKEVFWLCLVKYYSLHIIAAALWNASRLTYSLRYRYRYRYLLSQLAFTVSPQWVEKVSRKQSKKGVSTKPCGTPVSQINAVPVYLVQFWIWPSTRSSLHITACSRHLLPMICVAIQLLFTSLANK